MKLKTLHIAAFALNAALYVALGILVSTILPLNFGGVRFWPQVIIPAVFAAVFGPWVGGLGAAVGIFISDIALGGSAVLSLMAGVTSNFLGFWLLGYIAGKKINPQKSSLVYGALTAVAAVVAYVYTNLSARPISVGIIIVCYAVFLVIVWIRKKWASYELGSVVGLLVGSLIIGVMVPVYAVLFAPESTVFPGLTDAGVFALFTWTFVTEIPFMLALGPPIIEAINKAFPTLMKSSSENRVKPSEANS
ncbi:hypothetical protein E2P60_03560 [Candidatus Bathyarchaeota archaeon]|nr:hypothetical protein E2P60_03560 [Candidatus Bathyarchaeota archaeon]